MSQALPFTWSNSRAAVVEQASETSPTVLAWCLCLALFPFAASFLTFHPDERHYTDAAAQMVSSGDYLTPRMQDGHLRFNKPVLTYWLLVPWYHALGVTPLAGRLSFLLLSAAVLLLTHRLALLLYNDRRVALLAATMMATHAPLLSVAVNSIPEVPLTLCWLTCAYGFLGLVVLGRRDAIFYWAAYGGAGLGLAVKGLPILVLVAFAIAFARLNPWRRTSWRELWHTRSILVGAAVGLWWYVAVFATHGEQALDMFVHDQVTDRVGHEAKGFVKNLLLVALCYAATLMPWNFPLVWSLWSPAQPNTESNDSRVPRQAIFWFVALWAVVMGVVVALVERFAVRYLLAVTPLMAVVLADHLVSHQLLSSEKMWKRAGVMLFGLLCVVSAVLFAVRLQLCTDVAGLVVGGLLTLTGAWLCLANASWLANSATRLTLATMTMFPLAYLTLEPIALPDSGETFAEELRGSVWLNEPGFAYVGSPALASKARVMMRGDMRLFALSDLEDLAIPEYDALLLRGEDTKHLPPLDYFPAAEFEAGLGKVKPADVIRATVAGKLRSYLQQHRQKYVLLISPDADLERWACRIPRTDSANPPRGDLAEQ